VKLQQQTTTMKLQHKLVHQIRCALDTVIQGRHSALEHTPHKGQINRHKYTKQQHKCAVYTG